MASYTLLPHFYTTYAILLTVSPIAYVSSSIALWIEFKKVQPVTALAMISENPWNMVLQICFTSIPYSIMALLALLEHFRRLSMHRMENHTEVSLIYLSSVIGIIAQGALLPSTLGVYYWMIAFASSAQMAAEVWHRLAYPLTWRTLCVCVVSLFTCIASFAVAIHHQVSGWDVKATVTLALSFIGLLDLFFHLCVYTVAAFNAWKNRVGMMEFFKTGQVFSMPYTVAPTHPNITPEILTAAATALRSVAIPKPPPAPSYSEHL